MRARLVPGRNRRCERGGQRRDERGVVLVEVVLMVPFLITLMLGTYDLGMAWRDSLTISNAVRSAARVATNLGDDGLADHSALVAVAASLGSIPVSTIERVVVFKASADNGDVPAACLTASAKTTGGNSAAACNVYDSADITAVNANPTGTTNSFSGSCSGARWDRFWCPTSRATLQGSASGPDYLGVYVQVTHPWSTKLFGSSVSIDDTTVMRIEPGTT